MMMRSAAALLAVCLIGCQNPETDKPHHKPVHIDTDTAAEPVDFAAQALEEFTAYVEQNLDETGVPGASLAVLYEGQIYTATLGVRLLGSEQYIEEDTLFMYGSTTKTIMVAAILALIDEGAFSLDTKLSELIPGTVTDGTFDQDIDLNDLLTHSAGLPPFFEMGCGPAAEPLANWLGRMEPLDVWVEPGTLFSYSNSGYALVARAAEIATGDGFETVVAERALGPAGMANSSYIIPGNERAIGHLGPPWAPTQTDGIDCVSVRAAGGIWGTATDMARFAQSVMDGTLPGIDRYLGDPIPTGRGADVDYGFGMFEEPYRGLQITSHGGSVNGYGAALTMVPERDFAVVTLLNGFTVAGDPFEIGKAAIDIFLQPTGDRPVYTADPQLWEGWSGEYTAMDGGILEAYVSGGEMQVYVPATDVEVTMPYDAGETFRVSDDGILRVTFWLDDAGQPQWMSTPWGIGAFTGGN